MGFAETISARADNLALLQCVHTPNAGQFHGVSPAAGRKAAALLRKQRRFIIGTSEDTGNDGTAVAHHETKLNGLPALGIVALRLTTVSLEPQRNSGLQC